MKLAALLNPALVIPELAATTKRGVLEELAALLSAHLAQEGGAGLPPERIVEVLLERERLGSTGIGEGVALPHGKLSGLSQLCLGLARSRAGIDFEAADGRPAHLFFLLLSPEGSTRHLLALAALARLLRDGAVRARLLTAPSAEAFHQELLRTLEEA